MSNNWEPKELSIAQIDDNIKNGKYRIPRFQRGIVWTSEQRQDLIDTIKRGLPFGSILLYEDEEGTFLIIDGLQRSKALI